MADAPGNFDPAVAQSRINDQKAGMLTALAQGGTRMAQDYAANSASIQQQAVANLANQAATAKGSAVDGNAAFASQMAGAANGQAAYQQQMLGSANTAQQQYISNMQGAGSQYMDQLSAAIPLAQEDTQRRLNAIKGQADENDAARAAQAQAQSISLQEAKMSLAKAVMADKNANDPNSLDNQYKQAQIDNLRAGLDSKQDPSTYDLATMNQQALTDLGNTGGPRAQQALQAAMVMGKGDESTTLAALSALMNGGDKSVNGGQAITTPNGNPLDPAFMQDAIKNYYRKKLGLPSQYSAPTPPPPAKRGGGGGGGGLSLGDIINPLGF